MLRKGFIAMMCLTMALSCLPGCAGDPSQETSAPTETVLETTEPDDGSLRMYYDDRLAITELGGTEASTIEIKDQQVTSTKVGTDNPDMAVLYHDTENATLIAVGTGTATVVVDGKEQPIRVSPAPISLFLITGHSIGAGQCGTPAQSVVSQPGQAYSTHGTSTLRSASADMGIGFASSTKPQGIDAFAPGGGGTKGEGSALAYKWNQLTGEKVWVLNAAVGGSCIHEWVPGGEYYEAAIVMYKAAEQVLMNEIRAGHYKLKNNIVLYHSAANFGYKNVVYNDLILENWYDSMCNGFRKEFAMDFNGDGTAETIDGIGFVPSWSLKGGSKYATDKPTTYYLSASDAYPDLFTAGENRRNWCSLDLLKENFPPVDYPTQSEPVTMPNIPMDLMASDGTHMTQVGYNAAGLTLGEHLYAYLRTQVTVTSVKLENADGMEIREEINLRKAGATMPLVLRGDPIYGNNFTITVSDNLEIAFPFVLTAKAEGTGTLTISKDGKVLKTVTVNIG